jgi:hypothetical protein
MNKYRRQLVSRIARVLSILTVSPSALSKVFSRKKSQPPSDNLISNDVLYTDQSFIDGKFKEIEISDQILALKGPHCEPSGTPFA